MSSDPICSQCASTSEGCVPEECSCELSEPISDAGHTVADGLRHEISQIRYEAREKIALQEIALDDMCRSLNEERADHAATREELTKVRRKLDLALYGFGGSS